MTQQELKTRLAEVAARTTISPAVKLVQQKLVLARYNQANEDTTLTLEQALAL